MDETGHSNFEEDNNVAESHEDEAVEFGNVNLIYPICDSGRFVDAIEGFDEATGRNERKELQHKAMALLWAIRDHPEYWKYNGATDETVADLLGIVDGSDDLPRFDTWRRETESVRSTTFRGIDASCEVIHIPRPDERATRGLHTDVIVACSKRIGTWITSQDFMLERLERYSARIGIGIEEALRRKLGIYSYNLFFPTYPFPLVKEGTFAANQIVWENPTPAPGETRKRWIAEISDPVGLARSEFGLDIPGSQ